LVPRARGLGPTCLAACFCVEPVCQCSPGVFTQPRGDCAACRTNAMGWGGAPAAAGRVRAAPARSAPQAAPTSRQTPRPTSMTHNMQTEPLVTSGHHGSARGRHNPVFTRFSWAIHGSAREDYQNDPLAPPARPRRARSKDTTPSETLQAGVYMHVDSAAKSPALETQYPAR